MLVPSAQSAASQAAPGPNYPAAGVLPQTPDAGLDYAENTLFLGDSNTERMLYYADVTGVTVDNGFGVVGMGIGTFSTQGCARFEGIGGTLTMPEVVELLQPRRVVMTFGTNNVGMQVEGFIGAYREALAVVRRACPEADIIVGGVFPVDQYRQNTSITMKGIDEMNGALAEMCGDEGVYFLNWGEAMLDESIGYSLFESTIQDGVHLSRAGMQAVFNYFRTHSLPEVSAGAASPKAAAKRIAITPEIIRQDGKKQAGPIDWAKVEAQNNPVTVVFSAWDETAGASGGGSVSPGSVSVKPGGASGAVTASPAEGYVFAGWVFGSGASGGGGAATSISVDAAVPPGSTLTVTAVFRQNQPVPSSSSMPPSSVLPPPPSSAPPAMVTVPSCDNPGAWTLNYVTVPNNGSYAEGQFVSQSPAAGTQAAAVGVITVNVAGPPPAPEPPPPPSSSEVPPQDPVAPLEPLENIPPLETLAPQE